jgi:hypothetical protein
MFTWASVALAALKIVSPLVTWFNSLTSWMRERQIFKAGAANERSEERLKDLNAITKANQIRVETDIASARLPESDSLPDDGFRRD